MATRGRFPNNVLIRHQLEQLLCRLVFEDATMETSGTHIITINNPKSRCLFTVSARLREKMSVWKPVSQSRTRTRMRMNVESFGAGSQVYDLIGRGVGEGGRSRDVTHNAR